MQRLGTAARCIWTAQEFGLAAIFFEFLAVVAGGGEGFVIDVQYQAVDE